LPVSIEKRTIATEASVSLPEYMLRAGLRAGLTDLLSGARTAAQGEDGTIIMPPYGVRILQRR